MTEYRDTRPIGQLVSGLVNDVTGLFRKEVELAKAEASEKISNVVHGAESLVFGVILAVGAIGVLLAAAVSGIATLLIAQGLNESQAHALASLGLGLVIGIIAWVMISRGLSAMRADNLKLDRTASSVKKDTKIVKERI